MPEPLGATGLREKLSEPLDAIVNLFRVQPEVAILRYLLRTRMQGALPSQNGGKKCLGARGAKKGEKLKRRFTGRRDARFRVTALSFESLYPYLYILILYFLYATRTLLYELTSCGSL